MKFKSLIFVLGLSCPTAFAAPLDNNPKALTAVTGYADIVNQLYKDALTKTKALQAAVNAFTAQPSQETLASARLAWIDARKVWGQTEAFRFYEGPIDSTEGVEGFINAWPLDEAYIDSVVGAPNSGIINNPELYPVITPEVLLTLNEVGSETNVATGYHAVEFLLWGQDLSVDGPGNRPYTDYLSSTPHAGRRAAYLTSATNLLVNQIETLVAAWNPATANNYGAEFRASSPKDALTKVFKGLHMLLVDELAGERMYVAYDNQSQEDEHSCFSDTTHLDIIANVQSVWNVWNGQYGVVQGTSLKTLVEQVSPALAKRVSSQLDEALQVAKDLPTPYDSLILAPEGSEERKVFLDAIFTIQDAGNSMKEAAQALGLKIDAEI